MHAPFLVRKSVGGADGARRIEGIASTPERDLEDEIIPEEHARYDYFLQQAALNKAALDRFDFASYENKQGWLKFEHDGDSAHACKSCGANACYRESDTIVGWPVEVEKSHPYTDRNGMPCVGTRLVAELFPADAHHPFADSAWQLLTAIEKSNCPRKMGLSIEGAYTGTPAKDAATGIVNKSVLVTNIVLTTKPVNQGTMVWATLRKSLLSCGASCEPACVCKAVTAGYGSDSATLAGGAALRVQSHQGLKKRCLKRGCANPDHDHRLADTEVRRALMTQLVAQGLPLDAITAALCRLAA